MRSATVLLLLLVVFTNPAMAKVGVDFDPDYDFTTLRTYAWKPGQPDANELHQKRIVAGVDRELKPVLFTESRE